VIHVVTVITAKGEQQMKTTITEANAAAQATAKAEPLKPTKKARATARSRHVAPAKAKSGTKASPAKKTAKAAKKVAAVVRHSSKTSQILDLLKRPGGVTCNELIKATGWQPHSVRGFLSGTLGKKMGRTVTSTKGEDGERRYSVKA